MTLTERQAKALTLLAFGRPTKVIAPAAGYNSLFHLNYDLRAMRKKFEFSTTYELIYRATKEGLI